MSGAAAPHAAAFPEGRSSRLCHHAPRLTRHASRHKPHRPRDPFREAHTQLACPPLQGRSGGRGGAASARPAPSGNSSACHAARPGRAGFSPGRARTLSRPSPFRARSALRPAAKPLPGRTPPPNGGPVRDSPHFHAFRPRRAPFPAVPARTLSPQLQFTARIDFRHQDAPLSCFHRHPGEAPRRTAAGGRARQRAENDVRGRPLSGSASGGSGAGPLPPSGLRGRSKAGTAGSAAGRTSHEPSSRAGENACKGRRLKFKPQGGSLWSRPRA
jgi:hypothetical protein